jgi:hypothetical protein
MCVTCSWRTCILAFGFALKSGCDTRQVSPSHDKSPPHTRSPAPTGAWARTHDTSPRCEHHRRHMWGYDSPRHASTTAGGHASSLPRQGPLTMMGDFPACKSKQTLIRQSTVNTGEIAWDSLASRCSLAKDRGHLVRGPLHFPWSASSWASSRLVFFFQKLTRRCGLRWATTRASA